MTSNNTLRQWNDPVDSLSKMKFCDRSPLPVNVLEEVITGLSRFPKKLPPKFFYDKKGSELFDQICSLEEYYLTRTERRILQQNSQRIAAAIGSNRIIIEYGAGSVAKAEYLLSIFDNPFAYLPLDISREYLLDAAQILSMKHPQLWVLPVCADFTEKLDMPELEPEIFKDKKKVGLFLGSTIGNMDRFQAIEFLKNVAGHIGTEGGLLIGVDLAKNLKVLEKAYNDSNGITAQFNLNLLHRLNCELGADFKLETFEHQAFYNADLKRIEMHLKSRIRQKVHVGGCAIQFEEGETIHTENSYKYTPKEFADLAWEAGFRPIQYWTDPDHLYSIHYLEV
jgi:dimethylhistidine N-methyltransferase